MGPEVLQPISLILSAAARGRHLLAEREPDAVALEDGGDVAEGGPALLQPVLPGAEHGVRHGGALPPPPLLQRLDGHRALQDGSEGE